MQLYHCLVAISILVVYSLGAELVAKELETSFRGYSLIEVIPSNKDDLELLRQLDSNAPEDALDFWTEPRENEEIIPILVHPDVLTDVEEAFKKINLTFSIKIQDFQESIEQEQNEIEEVKAELEFRDPSNRLAFDLYTYHPLDEIEQYFDAINKSTRDLVVDIEFSSIGTTYEGRSILMAKIESKDKSKKRPAMWIDCGIHAREWISPAFCLYAIDRLLDPDGSEIIETFDVFIVPVVNPDGYVYTWTKNRMWRKNRREYQDFLKKRFKKQLSNLFPEGLKGLGATLSNFPVSSKINSKCVGADPNRNFDINFGVSGSSNDTCQDTFHGSKEFSEAESTAIKDAVANIVNQYGKARVAIFVSVHAYSQLWLSPYGHVKERAADYKDHQTVAALSVKALHSLYNTEYKYGPINEVIYQASGSSVDWAYTVLGIKYSYALELRDKGQTGFLLPVHQVQPTIEETWEGIKAMASAVSKEYPVL